MFSNFISSLKIFNIACVSLRTFPACHAFAPVSLASHIDHASISAFPRPCFTAPWYNPMSVVDNSAPLFFHSSHFNCNGKKSNPLSRVIKENINKIYKMQHFSTLGNAACKFFKTFRANPAWAECVSRDRGG